MELLPPKATLVAETHKEELENETNWFLKQKKKTGAIRNARQIPVSSLDMSLRSDYKAQEKIAYNI